MNKTRWSEIDPKTRSAKRTEAAAMEWGYVPVAVDCIRPVIQVGLSYVPVVYTPFDTVPAFPVVFSAYVPVAEEGITAVTKAEFGIDEKLVPVSVGAPVIADTSMLDIRSEYRPVALDGITAVVKLLLDRLVMREPFKAG